MSWRRSLAILKGSFIMGLLEIGAAETRKGRFKMNAQELTMEFIREALPPRKADGHKGDFGKVLIVGGAVGYTGAPCLAAQGAVRGGCGLVYVGVPESIWAVEAGKCTSAMPFPLPEKNGMLAEKALRPLREKLAGCDVLALGPGLGRSADTRKLALGLLETEKPVVLDADGINVLAAHIDVLDARRDRVTILTPHDGEFAGIGGDLSAEREEAARAFAVAHGCYLVRKGRRTLIATPKGTVLENPTGNAGLAKGGSGDVLTGLIASLLAQGASPLRAAAAGTYLHGLAGDLCAGWLTEYGMTPTDVAEALPNAFQTVLARACACGGSANI